MLTMQDWPVSYRLLAVIVLALLMGLVFGGLRVAAAVNSAASFGRVTQLATLGQQVTGLVQALEDERDETAGIIPGRHPRGGGHGRPALVRRHGCRRRQGKGRWRPASGAPFRPTSSPG